MAQFLAGILSLLLLIIPSAELFSQQDSTLITVRIPVNNKKSLSQIPADFHRENLKNDSLDLQITASEMESYKQTYPGLKVVPNEPQLDASDMAANLSEALTFSKYPTYKQYDSVMHYFAATYPSICRIDTFGTSVEGRLLLAVKISDNVHQEEDEPAFLYTSTMHGDELIGYMLTLRLIDFILKNYGSDVEVDKLVDELEIWINPLSNPDYTYYGTDNTVANSIRPSFAGGYRDLNRGFPDPSMGDVNDTAGIYPENQHMMLFMMKNRFNLSANLHSGAEVVNYPWDYKYELHPDNDWYVLISREYADLAHDVNPNYMDEFTDGITNGAEWYVIKGGRQDYVNYYLKGREVTLELSNIKKVESENLNTYWNYNKWSLLNYMAQARYGIHGNIRSGNTGEPLKAAVTIPGHDDATSWVESDERTGNFYRYLKEGNYTLVFSAEGYISDTMKNVEVTDFQKTELSVQLDTIGTINGTGYHVNQATNPANSLLRLYPNPASDLLYITLPDDNVYPSNYNNPASNNRPVYNFFSDNDNNIFRIELFNIHGKLVYYTESNQKSTVFAINLNGFPNGYYLLRLTSNKRIYHATFSILNDRR